MKVLYLQTAGEITQLKITWHNLDEKKQKHATE